MAKATTLNPLFATQREKAGPQTFSKYAYQYHWALYKVIREHEKGNEYAVFVEMHEDVVICNSLESDKAEFDFSQVKTTKGKFNKNSLIKLKKGSSVLGKLLSNYNCKPFSTKIQKLNLVAVNGFSMPLKDDSLELNEITLADLEDDCVKELAEAIKKEIALDPLPTNIHFVIPDLPDGKFQDLIISEVAKLITNKSPDAYYNPVEIYRILYDDISRKGMVTHDIKDWEQFLSIKALTSSKVANVINQFTNLKDEGKIQSKFDDIAKELGLNSLKAKKMEQAFNRYKQNRIGNKSTLQLDISKEISHLVSDAQSAAIDEWEKMFDYIGSKLSVKVKSQFTTQEELQAAIIYEFIIQK